MSTVLGTILAAAEGAAEHAVEEHEDHNKGPFFVAGLVFAGVAVVVAGMGIKSPDFPGKGGRSALIALAVVLALAGIVTAAMA